MKNPVPYGHPNDTAPVSLSDAEEAILGLIREAALAGEPCPRNIDIARARGSKSGGRVSIVISKMVKKRILESEMRRGCRIIRIVAEGIATAYSAPTYPRKTCAVPIAKGPDINALWKAGEFEGVKFAELPPTSCRYPFNGDPKDTVCCGEKVVLGKPYCPYHYRLTHVRGIKRDGSGDGSPFSLRPLRAA